MSDDREIRPGWLPPKAPSMADAGRPAAPQRPVFVSARPRAAAGPSSPLALTGIVMSAISLVFLVISIGVAWGVCTLLALMGMAFALTARQRVRAGLPGRESQVRTAIVFSSVALALSAVAAAVWLGLESNGITPQDLQDWLERELERRRAKPSD